MSNNVLQRSSVADLTLESTNMPMMLFVFKEQYLPHDNEINLFAPLFTEFILQEKLIIFPIHIKEVHPIA